LSLRRLWFYSSAGLPQNQMAIIDSIPALCLSLFFLFSFWDERHLAAKKLLYLFWEFCEWMRTSSSSVHKTNAELHELKMKFILWPTGRSRESREKEKGDERKELRKIESFWFGGCRSTRVCNQIISPKNREIITSEFLQIHFQFSTKSAKAFSSTRNKQTTTRTFGKVARIACKVAPSKDVWIFRHFWRRAPFVYFFEMWPGHTALTHLLACPPISPFRTLLTVFDGGN